MFSNFVNSICEIGATLLPQSEVLPDFTLSWSHYLVLMRIKNADERWDIKLCHPVSFGKVTNRILFVMMQ